MALQVTQEPLQYTIPLLFSIGYHPVNTAIASSRLEKKLRHLTGQAIADYAMIDDGDRVMVCLSGGKDSYAMLDLLLALQKKAPVDFSLLAVNLDQKQPGFPAHVLPQYLEARGVEYRIIEQDTFSIVQDKVPAGKTTCGLCSRLRRGILYRFAEQHGISKIALGHHREDAVETLLLNLFHGAKLKAMPPKLLSDDGKHVVIRPLYYCAEADLAAFAEERQYPIIPCNLCGSQPNMQRQAIKAMLADWEQQQPGRIENMARGLRQVVPSHLADAGLFDFAGLSAVTTTAAEGARLESPADAELPAGLRLHISS